MRHSRKQKTRWPWTSESQRRYTDRVIMRARAANRPTLKRFATWLQARGLCAGSITVRVHAGRVFVGRLASDGKLLATRLRRLSADDIERFFIAYCKDHGNSARRSMQAALRLFLRFAAQRGLATDGLVASVPTLRSYRLSGIPRGLGDQELTQVLLCLQKACARDRAIMYLLTTYGVRRRQVCTLKLQDIDWQERRVTFAGIKGGKAVTHVLTPMVADSLATYLRHERPAVDNEAVFLRRFPPHLRVGPTCVTSLVETAMRRAGLPRRGPHALRHAFATRLLAAGQSLKTIADLLGHRSLSSVGIYAKVDFARLREVAGEWPEVRP